MEENARFILTFTTTMGLRDEYEIPRANSELTEQEIITRMNDIVANGQFASEKGSPAEAESAELIETTIQEYM